MCFTTDLEQQLSKLSALVGPQVTAANIVETIEHLNDAGVVAVIETVANLRRSLDRVGVVAAGVAAQRSSRDRGYAGLATKKGHRTPVAMIQAITGGTASDARKALKAGEALLDAAAEVDTTVPEVGAAPTPAAIAWHAGLGEALLAAAITLDQHDAIRTGLGEPPAIDGRETEAVMHVWSTASARLVDEARMIPVEDLRARARALRDALDPAGANARLIERYERRSLRTWTDREGMKHSHVVWADEDGFWLDAIFDAALRPRRGGPRFVDSAEKAAAEELSND